MSSQSEASVAPPALSPAWGARVDVLRRDYTHGASWIARHACALLATCAGEQRAAQHRRASDTSEFAESAALAALAWELAWMRPSMAAVASAIAQVWARAVPPLGDISGAAPGARIEQLQATAREIATSGAAALDAIERHALPLLRDPVFTLSRSATVERVLLAAARARASNTPLRVIVAESEPGSEGLKLATSLREAGASVTVVADTAMAVAMKDARMLLLGADSVRDDGAVVNKAGSCAAALVANEYALPIYALFERLKITPTSYPLVLEPAPTRSRPRRREEVVSWLFDVTPAHAISAYITEDGNLPLETIAQVAADGDSALMALKQYVDQARQAPQ